MLHRVWTLKFNLRRAAKARVDRMVKPHGKRTWLNVPDWLREEWRTGKKDDIADILRDCNFDKDTLYLVIECKV